MDVTPLQHVVVAGRQPAVGPLALDHVPLGEMGGTLWPRGTHVAFAVEGGAIYPSIPSPTARSGGAAAEVSAAAAVSDGRQRTTARWLLRPRRWLAAAHDAVVNGITFVAPPLHHIMPHPLRDGTPLASRAASGGGKPCMALHPHLPLVAVAVPAGLLMHEMAIHVYALTPVPSLAPPTTRQQQTTPTTATTPSPAELLVTLRHAFHVGVSAVAWKPRSKDVLAVACRGGVMLWKLRVASKPRSASPAPAVGGPNGGAMLQQELEDDPARALFYPCAAPTSALHELCAVDTPVVTTLGFSNKSGRFLACASQRRVVVIDTSCHPCDANTIVVSLVVDAATGGWGDAVTAVAFSADDALLYAVIGDTLRAYDVATWTFIDVSNRSTGKGAITQLRVGSSSRHDGRAVFNAALSDDAGVGGSSSSSGGGLPGGVRDAIRFSESNMRHRIALAFDKTEGAVVGDLVVPPTRSASTTLPRHDVQYASFETLFRFSFEARGAGLGGSVVGLAADLLSHGGKRLAVALDSGHVALLRVDADPVVEAIESSVLNVRASDAAAQRHAAVVGGSAPVAAATTIGVFRASTSASLAGVAQLEYFQNPAVAGVSLLAVLLSDGSVEFVPQYGTERGTLRGGGVDVSNSAAAVAPQGVPAAHAPPQQLRPGPGGRGAASTDDSRTEGVRLVAHAARKSALRGFEGVAAFAARNPPTGHGAAAASNSVSFADTPIAAGR